ncbi:uncharacterized protein FYW23_014942 isoform 2-T2 [Sylvia borin]
MRKSLFTPARSAQISIDPLSGTSSPRRAPDYKRNQTVKKNSRCPLQRAQSRAEPSPLTVPAPPIPARICRGHSRGCHPSQRLRRGPPPARRGARPPEPGDPRLPQRRPPAPRIPAQRSHLRARLPAGRLVCWQAGRDADST